jgi:hypothetical protein
MKRLSSFVSCEKNARNQRYTNSVSRSQDSGNRGFRPHLQRRDREGFAPSSLTRESHCGGTLGESDKPCQVHYCSPLNEA